MQFICSHRRISVVLPPYFPVLTCDSMGYALLLLQCYALTFCCSDLLTRLAMVSFATDSCVVPHEKIFQPILSLHSCQHPTHLLSEVDFYIPLPCSSYDLRMKFPFLLLPILFLSYPKTTCIGVSCNIF